MDEIERLKRKVENYPSPSSYNRLAELLRLAGNFDEAVDLCNRSIQEFPRNSHAYAILAGIYRSNGNTGMAQDTLEKACEANPKTYSCLRMLADIYVDHKQLPKAISCLEEILTFKADDEGVRRRLADLKSAVTAEPTPTPAAQPSTRNNTDTIDLSMIDVDMTSSSIINPSALGDAAGTVSGASKGPPIAGGGAAKGPPVTGTTADIDALFGGAASAPATPAPAAPAKPSSADVLQQLCKEKGVQSTCITDQHGRPVLSQGMQEGMDELIGALAHDLTGGAQAVMSGIGDTTLRSWTLQTGATKIFALKRDDSLTLVVLADTEMKSALLELRARQALIDLGDPA